MKKYIYSDLSKNEREKLCRRNHVEEHGDVFRKCKEIEAAVLAKGDTTLIALAEKFDGVKLDKLRVSDEEWEACTNIDPHLEGAIRQAEGNIRRYHEQQISSKKEIETSPGVRCWREFRPLQSAGLYVPGGSAPLFSTALMLGIPAQIAGVEDIVICTPPNKDGGVAPEILWTAKLLGVRSVYKVGGAQAVFAMAYGTETVPKVDKVFGPGNRFLTTAKQQISIHTPIDMPAGASEVLVLADANANPVFVASDLLSQAEHGSDSQAILVTDSAALVEKVFEEINRQINVLLRKDIAKQALSGSYAMLCNNLTEGLDFANQYAPEHLILQMKDWESMIAKVQHAGSVFCGAWSPESAGDYASGPNHTLPTAGYARNYQGVSVETFGKYISFQSLTRNGLQEISKSVISMARAEGLDAHANAVSLRLAADD